MRLDRFRTRGSLKDGKLVLDNPKWFRFMLGKYEDMKDVVVSIERARLNRTKKQNNYYWGCVLEDIGKHVGEHPEDLHEIFKAKFLRRKRLWRGQELVTLGSTSKLTSDEFGEYIQRCIQEGAEMGVVVREADKNYNLIETTSL